MKLFDLLMGLEFSTSDNTRNIEIENVTCDVGSVRDATLFIIVRGINFDTGKIIKDIERARPAAVVCDEDWGIDKSIPEIRVSSARRALAYVHSNMAKIDYGRLKFIGVTGTNGKTTTATMIQKIFTHAHVKTGFIGTGIIKIDEERINEENYSMTTPDPSLLYPTVKKMQEAGCEVIVMEVSSHALELHKVAPITFEYSLFTNLSSEHMDFHESKEDYYKSKLKLFRQSKNGIFNADDEYSARAMRDSFDLCNTTSIGVLWDGAAVARDVIFSGFLGSSYIYREKGLLFKVELRLAGHYNIYNSLMALKCAICMGIRPCIAREAIGNLTEIDGRFEQIRASVNVIIDYAHTEKAMENILKTVNTIKNYGQNVITVFGCGGDRDKTKRGAMGKIAERLSSLVIVTSDNPRNEDEEKIAADILSGMKNPEKCEVILSRNEAIRHAILSASDGDIVLILGKGHERYVIDKDGYHYYDERDAVREALQKRDRERAKI